MSRSILKANEILQSGESLSIQNYQIQAVLQQDGNFIIYRGGYRNFWNAVFASNTCNFGEPPYKLVMQNDGNVVLYDNLDTPFWSTGTYDSGPNSYLKLEDDSNLYVHNEKGERKWCSYSGRNQKG